VFSSNSTTLVVPVRRPPGFEPAGQGDHQNSDDWSSYDPHATNTTTVKWLDLQFDAWVIPFNGNMPIDVVFDAQYGDGGDISSRYNDDDEFVLSKDARHANDQLIVDDYFFGNDATTESFLTVYKVPIHLFLRPFGLLTKSTRLIDGADVCCKAL
jgi:hypothetical protein